MDKLQLSQSIRPWPKNFSVKISQNKLLLLLRPPRSLSLDVLNGLGMSYKLGRVSNSALNFPLSLHFSSGITDKPLSFYGFLKDTGKYERCLRGKCRTLFDNYELTGRQVPAVGGKISKELTADEKKLDKQARLIISIELGHEREQITSVYLGR